MSFVAFGSTDLVFRNKDSLVDHLLSRILSNKNRKIGTEWEIFFVDAKGNPLTKETGQNVFISFDQYFSQNGYSTTLHFETDRQGLRSIAALEVHDLGTITSEIGNQIEFATSVCKSATSVQDKNDVFFDAAIYVAHLYHHRIICAGHIPGYGKKTQGSYRSRSVEWFKYYRERFGEQALSVSESLGATASIQVTIDSGSTNFHEFFQALLLIEPALSLHYANSKRSRISVCNMPRCHTSPIVGVWGTRTPRDAVSAIVERLLSLDVPFLPDPAHPGLYKASPLTDNQPPTLGDFMHQGLLNEKTLNNIGSFLFSRPALRRFPQGVLEMRGVDSQGSPDLVGEIAARVETLLYNDKKRKKLLKDYKFLTQEHIATLHRASTMEDKSIARHLTVAGMTVQDFITDIVQRSAPQPNWVFDHLPWASFAMAS